MQRGLAVWIFLGFLEDMVCAGLAQEVADQDTAFAIDERIDRHRILAFVFYRPDGILATARAQVAVVEPGRFDGAAELRLGLPEHGVHDCVEGGFAFVLVAAGWFWFHGGGIFMKGVTKAKIEPD